MTSLRKRLLAPRVRGSLLNPKSDGQFHARISIALSPIAGAASIILPLALGESPFFYFFLGFFGCILGIIFSSDLDQEAATYSERLFNGVPILGTLWMVLWGLIWFPYAALIPHRHALSHTPILSTAIRVIYFVLVVSLASSLLNNLGISISLPRIDALSAASLFIGLCVSDTGHWLRDYKNLTI